MEQQQGTTPTPDVPQPSLDDKIAAKFGYGESPEPQEQQEVETPEDGAPSDEPVIEEEGEAEPQQSEAEFVEIKHNGQVKRVSKEESVNLIQKGFDYESKMAELKADRQRIQSTATALQAQQALNAQIVDHLAVAKSYENAIRQMDHAIGSKYGDWVRFSNDDPVAAFQERQKYDQLYGNYQQAMQQVNAVAAQEKQVGNHITQEQLQYERKQLLEAVPEWRDEARFNKDVASIRDSLLNKEFSPEELKGIDWLFNNHKVVKILRKAWKYDQAIEASKANKGQKPVPQGPKPGQPVNRVTKQEAVRDTIKQLHQAKDPQRKKALFDQALSAKFGLK